MTEPHSTPAPPATAPDATSLHRLVDAELSLPSRLGHVSLLLAAAMMTTVVGALWTTEPALPLRTQIAFAAMTVAGLAWVGYSVWVLTHRRPLLAGHGVVAGRMAVAFTALFVVGALAVGLGQSGTGPYLAAAVGAAMLATAVTLLLRARRTLAQLLERRQALERELAHR